jgi:hypothetical protein
MKTGPRKLRDAGIKPGEVPPVEIPRQPVPVEVAVRQLANDQASVLMAFAQGYAGLRIELNQLKAEVEEMKNGRKLIVPGS